MPYTMPLPHDWPAEPPLNDAAHSALQIETSVRWRSRFQADGTQDVEPGEDRIPDALQQLAVGAAVTLLKLPDGRQRVALLIAYLVRHMSAEAWREYQTYQARVYAAHPDHTTIPSFAEWLAGRLWL
jgi:hypothetical protein